MGMFAPIAVLIVSILFFSLLGNLYFHDIIIPILNGLILYILLYRAYFDLRKGRWKAYVVGLLAGIVIDYFLPRFTQLWPITIVVMINFIIVEILRATNRIEFQKPTIKLPKRKKKVKEPEDEEDQEEPV